LGYDFSKHTYKKTTKIQKKGRFLFADHGTAAAAGSIKNTMSRFHHSIMKRGTGMRGKA
jgi:hypothetical protein